MNTVSEMAICLIVLLVQVNTDPDPSHKPG